MVVEENTPEIKVKKKKREILRLGRRDFMRQTWRPTMAYVYAGICIADFVLFPILWSILQAIYSGNVTMQWTPITLQGAGLIHLSFGSILGVAAWSRNEEKKNGND